MSSVHCPIYKYFGTALDSSSSLINNFNKMYKRAMSKLFVLLSLQNYLDITTKSKVFHCMILLCITYNCTVSLNFNQTRKKKLKLIDKLVCSKHMTVENEIKIRSIMLVRKCIDKMACRTFNQYFEIQNHGRGTRNNGFKL